MLRFAWSRPMIAGLLTLPLVIASQSQASANQAGEWHIRYGVSVSGFTLGKIDIDGSIKNQSYSVKGDARLVGLVGAAFKIRGGANVKGTFKSDKNTRASTGYKFHYSSPRTKDAISMKTSAGSVTSLQARPLPDPLGTRVKVTKRHKSNVADPITAFLLPARNATGQLAPEDCKHTVPVFDGRERFDVKMSYKGKDTAGGRHYKGYRGPVLICSARYKPIAGHRSDDELAAFSAKSKGMEVWLAPLYGTRRLFPYKITLPTPFGKAVIVAERFDMAPSGVQQSKVQ